MLFISRLKLKNFKSFKHVDVELPRSFLCLTGPNGSGKCVDGDTEVYLADGTTIRIRDLVNEAISKGHVKKIDDGYISQYNFSKEILCLDKRTLKVIKNKITAFVKRKAPEKMLKVRTMSGRKIIATEYHPFFIFDGNEIRSIRADELKEKIKIAIPMALPIDGEGELVKLPSESDVLWDEIEKVEQITPREEWVYDLTIERHHNFIANGIFVHNSNLGDAIRFALGEISLKSLRAKRVKDLIFHDAEAAEVALFFDGSGKYDIRRAIRKDGKISYRLNGKKTTRWAILDALKKYNLDESGRNIVAQGEVQNIVNMSGKERRAIIDSVAGVSDFENKKKEALKELETVEGRIREANLILGERMAFLEEVKKEREVALQFIETKKRYESAKATLLHNEVERYEKELSNAIGIESKLQFNIEKRKEELRELERKVDELEGKRAATSRELQLRQQTAAIIKRVEELKASINSKMQIVDDRELLLKKLDSDKRMLAEQVASEDSQIKTINEEIEELRTELKKCEENLHRAAGPGVKMELIALREGIKKAEKELSSLREELIAIDAEINAKNEILEIKMKEEAEIKPKIKEGINIEDERQKLEKDSASLSSLIESSFRKMRERNAEIAALDKKMLELREKVAVLRVKASPSRINPALTFINHLKERGERRLHGLLIDLIKFDPEYSAAVEGAAGSRLLYAIVDDASTAAEIIKKLKAASSGRVTFIPLKEIKVDSMKQPPGCKLLSSVIIHPSEIKKAVDFVFGDTLLVKDMEEAKKIGIGKHRMVTLDGEVFERSGLISGGKAESGLLIVSQLKKLEEELAHLRNRKDELTKELIEAREYESRLRSQKAEIEIRLKSLEVQAKMEAEHRKEEEEAAKRKERLVVEIEELKNTIKKKHQQKDSIASEIAAVEKKISNELDLLKKAEKKAEEFSEAEQKRMSEQVSRVSSLRATIEGKLKELELRKEEHFEKQKRIKENEKERVTVSEKITELKRAITNEKEELSKLEEKIRKHSSEIEMLFESIKSYETQLQEFGKLRGEKKLEIERLEKELMQLSIKKATAETRLADLRAEFSKYQDVKFLEMKKEELAKTIAECEEKLVGLGNVNMAAIDAYEKKKAEIDEIKEKVDKLSAEREAIFSMIGELEEKKKAAFFDAFYAANDYFRKMFKYVNMGEGYLYLDKPNDPFESGLYIKIKRGKKEHSIDSLSGGESSLVALMFLFALQFFKPSPFYILDEVDAALDKENSKRLVQLINEMSKESQFIMVSHNDIVMSGAMAVLGVTRVDNVSKVVGIKLERGVGG